MSRDTNTLYPVDYVEPEPAPVLVDDAASGRDFDRLRTIINDAVPRGGEPMTLQQLKYIVRGRNTINGDWVEVGVDPSARIRAAAFGTTPPARETGIRADPACVSIRLREAKVVFDEIVAEREPTWTFLPSE